MDTGFTENISLTHGQILVKIVASLIIAIVAFVLKKLFDSFLARWQKKIVTRLEKEHPAAAPAIRTKVITTRRIIGAVIYFFAFVIFLMQFEAARNIGAGLLAGAGVAGIVLGMAAQNTLSNIIAGISISFAQPVRLNDAVIFENDFGWVEEITLMHTIIRTWDNRRVVAPNNVLVNRVIQNWTLKDPSLLGVVMVYVDYFCDVDMVKKWVKEIVDNSSYSTAERVAAVQVVDFTEKSMVLRVLGKGPDAPNTWNLRCEIREALIKKFKETKLPLPRIRVSGDVTKS